VVIRKVIFVTATIFVTSVFYTLLLN
jgi:hypothetical protein